MPVFCATLFRMRKREWILVLIWSAFTAPSFASVAPLPQLSSPPVTREVRVRVAHSAASSLWSATIQGVPTGAARRGTWTIACTPAGAAQIAPPLSGAPAWEHASVNGIPYAGRVVFRKGAGGCALVNHVALEDYVASLLNTEMSSRFPREALRAQAIAARSYTLARMRERRGQAWDVESSVADQVYAGSAQVDRVTREAAVSTRGMVLRAGVGHAELPAYYHSTCGGETEVPAAAWGMRAVGAAARRGFARVRCGFCSASPRSQWSDTWSGPEFAARLAPALGVRDARRVRWLQMALSRAGSRRVKSVRLVASVDGVTRAWDVAGPRFREVVGAERLKSLDFEAAVGADGGVRFSGRGFGHGVGLCQWGAAGMAQRGFRAEQILAHYYPGARVSAIQR